ARNAGIKVPKETIDRAVAYVQRCQNPDGGFRYMTMPGESLWPRSAAGVATLYYAGIYEGQSIARGLQYLMRNAMPGPSRAETHYHYGNYYTAQAMYLAGDDYWDQFWPAIRTELLARQDQTTGAWHDPYTGGPYGTAMSLIVLQMPKKYLPIFQR
ncbi:MAG: prenyltransferase/squalene oxidase repeat-containing protein, partial [Planctomycetota bacterium]